ncbi:MAG: CoA-binding protein [Bacteroidota bacterium]
MKEVLVLGASVKEERYSNKLVRKLLANGYLPIAHGRREGRIGPIDIQTELPKENTFHAISIYLSAKNQRPFEAYILSSNSEKILFNPGAENEDLFNRCLEKGLNPENACSLVQLSIGIL